MPSEAASVASSSRTAAAGVLKLGLDRLELVGVHAAVEQPQGVLVEAFLEEPLLQVEQRLLVLGEDDQPLVVPELAFVEQVLLDPVDQGFGLGVGLPGQGGEFAGVLDVLAVVAQASRAWLTFRCKSSVVRP